MMNMDELRVVVENMAYEAEQEHAMFPEDNELFGRFMAYEKVAMMLRSDHFFQLMKDAYMEEEEK